MWSGMGAVWSGIGAVCSEGQCVVRGVWSGMGAVWSEVDAAWSVVVWRGSVSSRVKWGTTKVF